MGINDRDYMRRPVSTPAYTDFRPQLRRESAKSRRRIWSAVKKITGELLILACLSAAIGLIGWGQLWLLENAELAFVPRALRFLVIAMVGVFACVAFLRKFDSLLATPVDAFGGLLQIVILTGMMAVGAVWLGVDFRVIFQHEATLGGGIPVFMGIVAQTPWWYLLLCVVVTGPLFAASTDGEILHWQIGTGFAFAVSAAYFTARILLDTGLYERLF